MDEQSEELKAKEPAPLEVRPRPRYTQSQKAEPRLEAVASNGAEPPYGSDPAERDDLPQPLTGPVLDAKAAFPEMVGDDGELLAMLRAGVHFGHRKSRINPKMLPYVFGVRNNVHIIDLTKTKERLAAALEYLSELRRQGKTILFVGTRPAAQALVRDLASALGMPYVTSRWVGGTLTNFAVITKRLEYFRGLEAKQRSGELEKYTKHERHLFEIERRRLEEKFGGIKDMRVLPDALFLADLYEDELAAREARRKGIPVVALADTNTDPTLADYPIPANDDALGSLQYLLGRVKEALKDITPEALTTGTTK